ncbi:MAG: DNA polymerase III subunit delta, partial [Bradymonadaceae bacterium]
MILHAYRDGPNDLDMRKGVFRTLKKAAESFEFESLYDGDAEDVVRKHAQKRGLSLTSGARAYLVDAVGTDIASLSEALDKIDLYLGESDEEGPRRVETDNIQEVIAETRVRSIFDLTDALGDCEYEKAITILDRMLLAGEPPLRILHMIARHFRLVTKLHDPSVRSLDKGGKAGELNVPYFFVDDYQRHARTFSTSDLADIRSHIL